MKEIKSIMRPEKIEMYPIAAKTEMISYVMIKGLELTFSNSNTNIIKPMHNPMIINIHRDKSNNSKV